MLFRQDSNPGVIRTSYVLVGVVLLWGTCARGVDKFWMVDGGDYNVDANWNPTGVPNNDTVFIVDGLRSNLAATPPPAFRMYLGGTADFGGVTNGGGTLNQSGGDLHIAGTQSWMVVADKAGDPGTYNLSGGSLLIDDDYLTIGQSGTGFLNVSGNGSISARGLNFGRWDATRPGSSGTATGTGTLKEGGVITARDLGFNVGREGIGVFTQEGGTVNVGTPGAATDYQHWAFIGGHDEARGPRTGTYNMSGGEFKSVERVQIAQGPGSTGTFNQTGGNVTVGTRTPTGAAGPEGFLEVGQGGVGTYNLSAGNVDVVRSLVVGAWNQGDGRLNVTGGTINIGEALQVARGSINPADNAHPVAGLVDQKGGVINTFWTEIGTSRLLGRNFVGTYKLSGEGVLNIQFEMNIGRNNGEGVFEMSGGTVNVGLNAGGQKTFNIGRGGKGTFLMSGGTITLPEGFMLSSLENNIVGTGTGTQTGGTINTNWVSIGQHNAATYTMSGGTINARGDFNVGDVTGIAPYQSTFNLGGDAVVNATTTFIGKNPGTGGIVNQTGGRFVVGAGGVTIARDATSTGAYNLQGGVLDGISNNTLRFGAGTAAFNMTGGVLKNFSAVQFGLNNQGGRVIVGDTNVIAAMNITGGYAQSATGALEVDIQSPNVFETLLATGDAMLAGNLTINKDPTYTPVVIGQTFDVVGAASVAGEFDTITGNDAGGGLRFAPRYTPTSAQLVATYGGDTDIDFDVGFDDFQRLERNFGLSGKRWREGDFTGDGAVTFEDFRLLFDNFGQSSPPLAAGVSDSERASLAAFYAAHVPEPGLAVLGSLGALYVLGRRRVR